jgi:RNA polymerase sigma-70 factor, ECF subfamily
VNPTDEDLIAACRNGQTEAFSTLVERYQERLFHTLAVTLGSADDARDVAQEAFILAFQKLHTFREQSAFYSWLFRIALNTAASSKRRKSRATVSLDGVRDATGEEPIDRHAEQAPDYALESNERQQRVRAALADLTDEYRDALVLKEIEGLKYEEIAERLAIPVGTVRSRIHRARQELRERLAGFMSEESQRATGDAAELDE